CFFKQALEAGKIAGANKVTQKRILDKLAKDFPKFSLSASPPEIGRDIYAIVRKITKKKDPFAKIKAKSNTLALNIYKKLKNKVAHSSDRLLMATELAIAGNIIDYGVKNSLNVDTELARILAEENRSIKQESKVTFDYNSFKRALKKSHTILYLGDNAGETVFDRVLIEEIKRDDKNNNITYAVKKSPVINDALIKDAIDCGIDKSAKIISSGSDAPGTVLSLCKKSFLNLFNKADMVISKGQGNFEALSGSKRPVFFLFMAKCPVVAQHVGCKIGDIILSYHPGKRKI
ncbi:MAG: ARMT1-like domain-containing protein, partial [Candidatus Orphnella occulta]|nr:ARMT1-like domain-containing protein [Candidatus Orphnella occulta]